MFSKYTNKSNSIGSKISFLRKGKGLTQESLAEKLGVTPQAVSKWENDIACPDIVLLPIIADIFETSIDELFSKDTKNVVKVLPEKENTDNLTIKVIVVSSDGDKIKINLPFSLIKSALEIGFSMPQVASNENLKDIDFAAVVNMVEKGVIGNIVDIESADGDIVKIVVE